MIKQLFGLRVPLSDGILKVIALEGQQSSTHTRIDIDAFFKPNHEKRFGILLGSVANLWISIPSHRELKSNYTKALVLEAMTSKFNHYSSDVLKWIDQHGDELKMISLSRYGEVS